MMSLLCDKTNSHRPATSQEKSAIHLLYILLIPFFLVLGASGYTIYLSMEGADRPVAEHFDKNGLHILANNRRYEKATALGITTSLLCEQDRRVLLLETSQHPNYSLPPSLILHFIHRIDPIQDKEFILHQDHSGYYRSEHDHLNQMTTGAVPGYWIVKSAYDNWSLKVEQLRCALSTAKNSDNIDE